MRISRRRSPVITLRIVVLEYNGLDASAIAAQVAMAPATVAQILASPEAARIRKEVEARVMDTQAQVQTDLQAFAPVALKEKMELAMNAKSETVRNAALTECLQLAGHVPVKQVAIHRADPIEEEYADKSEQDIRDEILADLASEREAQLLH